MGQKPLSQWLAEGVYFIHCLCFNLSAFHHQGLCASKLYPAGLQQDAFMVQLSVASTWFTSTCPLLLQVFMHCSTQQK